MSSSRTQKNFYPGFPHAFQACSNSDRACVERSLRGFAEALRCSPRAAGPSVNERPPAPLDASGLSIHKYVVRVAVRLFLASLAYLKEKSFESLPAIFRSHLGAHREAVVETRILGKIEQRPEGAGFGVPGAKHDARDA